MNESLALSSTVEQTDIAQRGIPPWEKKSKREKFAGLYTIPGPIVAWRVILAALTAPVTERLCAKPPMLRNCLAQGAFCVSFTITQTALTQFYLQARARLRLPLRDVLPRCTHLPSSGLLTTL